MEYQRQSRKRRAEADKPADLDSPTWKLNPFAVRVAPEVRVDSILRLIPAGGYEPPRGRTKVPKPQEFPRPGRELRQLRASKVWRTGTLDQKVAQMDQWFPDLTDPFDDNAPPKPLKAKASSSAMSIDPTSAKPEHSLQRGVCPTSDIGIFSKLPGELRNRICRMAFVDEEEPTKFAMEPGTCSTGTCLHSNVAYNVPGIANTCRQLRWEVMPIFCYENKAFQFDELMVHQNCVGNFIRSIGDYADIVPEYQFVLKRPLWNRDEFQKWSIHLFTLETPIRQEEKIFELDYTEPEGRKICACPLDKVIDEMNDRWENEKKVQPPIGKMILDFTEGEEFADYVWRMRKSKQWTQSLDKCSECGYVVFNN